MGGSESRFVARNVGVHHGDNAISYLCCPPPHKRGVPKKKKKGTKLVFAKKDVSDRYMQFVIKPGHPEHIILRFDHAPQPYIGIDPESNRAELQKKETDHSHWSVIIYGKRESNSEEKFIPVESVNLTWEHMKGHELLVAFYHPLSGQFLGVDEQDSPALATLPVFGGHEIARKSLWCVECVDHNLSKGEVTMAVGFSSIPLIFVGGVAGAVAVGVGAGVVAGVGAVSVASAMEVASGAAAVGCYVVAAGTTVGGAVAVGGVAIEKQKMVPQMNFNHGSSLLATAAADLIKQTSD